MDNLSGTFIYRIPLVKSDRRIFKIATNDFPKSNIKGEFSPGLYFCSLVLKKDFNFHVKEYDFIKNGKPVLNSGKFGLSVSYTDDYVFAAIIKNSVIGIDAEQIIDIELKVAEEFMSKNELIKLGGIKNKIGYFYRLWTLKEAYLKLTGEGINDRIKGIEFLKDESGEFSLYLDSNRKTYFNNFIFKNCSISIASYTSLNYKIIDFETLKDFLEKYED